MKTLFLIGLFSALLIIPMIGLSEGVLWDLIIHLNLESEAIFPDEIPIVSGQVVDQAGRPIEDAKIHVRSGSESIFATTDESGQFRVELANEERIPGIYIVNVIAKSLDGKTGIATIEFQVKGELNPYSATEQKLSTPEAKKYLNSEPGDFVGNSIGLTLYHYYQGILEEYLEKKQLAEKFTEDQLKLEKQRLLAQESFQTTLEEYKPGPGVYSGWKYERYVESLDDSIKGTIVDQLNYTRNSFFEAQSIMNSILENGGTYEEARAAYLERMSMPKSLLETMTNQTNIINENQTGTNLNVVESVPENSEEDSNMVTLESLMGQEGAEIRTIKDSIFVTVNGISHNFILEDGKFVLSSQFFLDIPEYSCTLVNNYLICPQELENFDNIFIKGGNQYIKCHALIFEPEPSTERKGITGLSIYSPPESSKTCASEVLYNVNYFITGKIIQD